VLQKLLTLMSCALDITQEQRIRQGIYVHPRLESLPDSRQAGRPQHQKMREIIFLLVLPSMNYFLSCEASAERFWIIVLMTLSSLRPPWQKINPETLVTNRLKCDSLKLTDAVPSASSGQALSRVEGAVEGLTHPFGDPYARYKRTSMKGRSK